jgi:hypothetical protein
MRKFYKAAVKAIVPPPAGAGVHTHVDPVSGMIIMSNVAPLGRTALRGRQESVPAQPRGAADAFPQVSAQRQRQMDDDRRAILQEELAHERQALAAASGQRAAGDVLARHMANVAALQRELEAVAGRHNN